MAKVSRNKKKKAVPKAGLKPGKTKSWTDKVNAEKEFQVKRIDKAFADIPAGGKMLIATPKIVDDYVRQIPKGKQTTLLTMRNDLAHEYNAEYTCPLTAGIFLRIVSEAANEQLKEGKPLNKVAPFWRVVDEKSSLAKKLSFGTDFIKRQRRKEGIDSEVARKK